MKARTRTRASRPAGRTGVSLALAATTVAAMTVPAGATSLPPTPHTVSSATVGATALALAPKAPQRSAPTASYQVRAGDTVSGIAARTGTSIAAIVAANGLDSRAFIRAGQMLRVPSAAAAAPARPAAAPARAAATHTVAAGDTVSALATRYGTSVPDIVAANSLDSRALIIVGQRLTIPGGGGSSATARPAVTTSKSTSTGTASRTHVVAAGETVSGIAARYGSTVSRIAAASGLRDAGVIQIGQRLTIPGSGSGTATVPVSNTVSSSGGGSSSASRSHTVSAGETVSGLAARYGTTTSAIISANNLRSNGLIYVGQRLTIGGSASAGTTTSGGGQLVGDTFLGRTYASNVVSAANTNKATLLAMDVPSRDRMRTMVRDTAVRMGVDPALALAVAQQESGFDARAVSPANAVGTMQVIPSSGEWASDLVGRRLNLLDPQDNVTAGVAILRQLVRTADSFEQAVAGYYQGLAGVKRNGMYPDTRNYVAGITSLMRQF